MYGFGTIQPKNINQIVAALEKQINDIKSSYASDYSVISNKIEKCETYLSKLKEYIKVVQDYTETEYQKLQTQIESFESQISKLKENLNQVNYSKAGQETVAVGIAPLNEYSDTGVTHPFSAKYAVNDSEGNNIVGTYATKDELNNAGQQYSTELSSVSSTLQENIATEVNRATESEQYLTDNLTGEVTRSMGAENTISADLSNEVTRATNKENQLQQSIETLTNTVNAKENSLSAQIEAETTRATAKEIELGTAISNETTNRINTDSDLQTQINALTASLPVIVDSFTSAINAEETRAIEVEEALDSKIDSRVETINGTISDLNTSLSNALDQEITNRTNAESALQTNINNEVSERSEADTTLQTNIDNEATTRANKDTELSGAITAEETARTNADETLQSNIDAEENARIAKDTDLQNQIDTIEATQNIVDIVGTKADLNDYDTTYLKDGAKIQVLDDETQNHASTIYQFNKNAVPNPSFGLVGTFGSYYTKAETEGLITSARNDFTSALNTETSVRTDADTLLSGRIDNLASTKQNNLSAGDGIDITNDVVSHSIKIIENNNQEDVIEGTVFTVYLKNNHYKMITFDKTITEIIFMIEKSATGILQETGFEFTVPEDSELETLTFKVIDDNNKKIYTIIPDSYSSPNIYQGTIVNYRCTIGEYEVED
jgi:hypothetical protein